MTYIILHYVIMYLNNILLLLNKFVWYYYHPILQIRK